MALTKLAAIGLALAWPAPAAAGDVVRWRSYVEEASGRFGLPTAWIERVMGAESGGNRRWNGRPIVSPAGAMGLMQLMPGTWAAMRDRIGLGADPHDPRDNILAGTLYLRLMYDRFGYPGLFAAYNAGPARYAEHVERGRALPAETRAYVVRVAAAGGGGSARAEPMLTRARVMTAGIFFSLTGSGLPRGDVQLKSGSE